MKSLIITSLFLWGMVSSNFAQKNSNWRTYYALVDTAEINIVDSVYQKALSYYNKAFNIVEIPYGKDLYNAALCASKIGDYTKTTDLLNHLVEKGIAKVYFEDNDYFMEYRKSQSWKDFVDNYNIQRNKYNANINSHLKDKFKNMLDRDQYYTVRKYNTGYGDSCFIENYKQIKDFIEIINKYGFPDENLIGLTTLPFENIYGLIIIHFFQNKDYFNHPRFFNDEKRNEYINKGIDFNSINLDSILKVAVFQGKYHPQAFYNASDIKLMLQVDDTIAMLDYSSKKLHQLDSIRQSYGLCSMELYKKKGLYALKIISFRPKLKSESVDDYYKILDKVDKPNKDFVFGLYPIMNMFLTDKDLDHIQFKKIYNRMIK
jgi:hypothetical protein